MADLPRPGSPSSTVSLPRGSRPGQSQRTGVGATRSRGRKDGPAGGVEVERASAAGDQGAAGRGDGNGELADVGLSAEGGLVGVDAGLDGGGGEEGGGDLVVGGFEVEEFDGIDVPAGEEAEDDSGTAGFVGHGTLLVQRFHLTLRHEGVSFYAPGGGFGEFGCVSAVGRGRPHPQPPPRRGEGVEIPSEGDQPWERPAWVRARRYSGLSGQAGSGLTYSHSVKVGPWWRPSQPSQKKKARRGCAFAGTGDSVGS